MFCAAPGPLPNEAFVRDEEDDDCVDVVALPLPFDGTNVAYRAATPVESISIAMRRSTA